MRRTIFALFITAVALYSCTGNRNKDMLPGTWRSLKVENHEVDDFFINSQKYIDTVGKNNDVATNIALYGVANMDSMRVVMQREYDSVKLMQQMADTQTIFRFEKDSVASLIFPGRTEAGQWYLDEAGKLVLVGATENGEKETTRVEIVSLNKDTLRLKFVKAEDNVTDTSYVTFLRERK